MAIDFSDELNGAREASRLVYIQKTAGKGLSLPEAVLVAKLILLDKGANLEAIEKAVDDLQRRSVQSFGVLAYLVPSDEEISHFLSDQGHLRKDAVLLGSGFFGNTTGIIHDLIFDYPVIDSLFSATDRSADSHLLELLLEDHSDRMIFAMAEKSDERRKALFSEANLEAQQVVGDGVFYGRKISKLFEAESKDEEIIPLVISKPAAKVEEAEAEPTKEETLEELRSQLSEALDYEVSVEVTAKIFGGDILTLADVAYWGAGDTLVRETAASTFSKALIGEEWPINGAKLSEDEFAAWVERVVKAHDELLKELKG